MLLFYIRTNHSKATWKAEERNLTNNTTVDVLAGDVFQKVIRNPTAIDCLAPSHKSQNSTIPSEEIGLNRGSGIF